MSSLLCFICHSIVNENTEKDILDKYRDLIGFNLCSESHLCYICCHMINKLWSFKSICLKRSLEYPMLFSEKGTQNFQQTITEKNILCPEDDCLHQNTYLNFHYKAETSNDDYLVESFETERNNLVQMDQNITEALNDLESDNFHNDIVEDMNYGLTKEDDSDSNDDDGISNVEKEEANGDDDEVVDDAVSKDDELNMEVIVSEKESKPKKKAKKRGYKKIVLSLEEQKAELEAQRRSKKYTEAEFKCYNCALGFLFKDTYQTHMMRHEESNGEYLCSACGLRFASARVLRAHTALHAERHVCNVCGATLRHNRTRMHATFCHKGGDASATCHLCGNVFRDASGLQQHLKRFHHSKNTNRTYSCNICGNSYSNQAAVRTHMIKHIQRKFKCADCDAIFSSPYTLNQHKKKHSEGTTNEQHFCDTCGVGYASRKSLLAHRRNALNHQQRAYECPICNRPCPNERALSSHVGAVHSGTKSFGCPYCHSKYSNRKSLVRHIGTHTKRSEPRIATCHLCGKHFKGNSKLNRHLREVCEKDKLEEELSSYYEQQIM